MEKKTHVLSYGIRSVKNMKSENVMSRKSIHKLKAVKELENYFTTHIDHVISRCITYILCVQPSTSEETLRLMLNYFIEVSVTGNIPTVVNDGGKPRRDQKVLLATTIGPIISKLVNRMIFLKPQNPIEYFIQELKMLVDLDFDRDRDRDRDHVEITAISQCPVNEPSKPVDIITSIKSIPDVANNNSNDSNNTINISISPELNENKPQIKRRLQIGLFGMGGSGKTTILNSIQGEVDGNVKPTLGFRPITLSLNSNTTVCFYDLGGSAKIRDIWPQYYHDIHGVIYVFDSSISIESDQFEESKKLFEELLRHELIKSKPILIVANKQDQLKPDTLQIIESLTNTSSSNTFHRIECSGIGMMTNTNPKSSSVDVTTSSDSTVPTVPILPDKRIDEGLEWLIQSIIGNFDYLHERVTKDTLLKAQEDLKKQLARERKVLKNKIASVFYNCVEESLRPTEITDQIDDVFDETEGLQFLASEIGEDVSSLNELTKKIASLLGYQRLALQIIGALKCPISKKKTPMSWDDIFHLVVDIRKELGLESHE